MFFSKSATRRKQSLFRVLTCQPLEARRVLAASLGWDGPGLGSAQLTYNIANTPSSLSQAETTAAIETALAAWSSVADITFTPTNQRGLRDSIDISFSNIDGAGRTLAQAYFPDDVNPARIAGDVQFDSSENWEVGNSLGNRAFDLVWVAVHEIGHALGLDHMTDAGSVLGAYVSANQQFVSLDASDIAGIQSLYAPADSVSTPPLTNVATSPEPVANTNSITTDTPTTDDSDLLRRFWSRRSGSWWRFVGRLEADSSVGHNLFNPTDTNNDGSTSAIDVLTIINQINLIDGDAHGLCDVNADGNVSAMDVLMVINTMNGMESSALPNATPLPEAESDSSSVDGDTPDLEATLETTLDDDVAMLESPMDEGADEEDFDCNDGEHGDRFVRSENRLGRFGGAGLIRGGFERLITRSDANADGAITEDEVPESVWQRLVDQGLDTDLDNAISQEEFDVYATEQRAEKFATKDVSGDGLLTEDEVSSRFWQKISAADTSEDGGVSLQELETWLETRTAEVPLANEVVANELASRGLRADRVFAEFGRALRGRRN